MKAAGPARTPFKTELSAEPNKRTADPNIWNHSPRFSNTAGQRWRIKPEWNRAAQQFSCRRGRESDKCNESAVDVGVGQQRLSAGAGSIPTTEEAKQLEEG